MTRSPHLPDNQEFIESEDIAFCWKTTINKLMSDEEWDEDIDDLEAELEDQMIIIWDQQTPKQHVPLQSHHLTLSPKNHSGNWTTILSYLWITRHTIIRSTFLLQLLTIVVQVIHLLKVSLQHLLDQVILLHLKMSMILLEIWPSCLKNCGLLWEMMTWNKIFLAHLLLEVQLQLFIQNCSSVESTDFFFIYDVFLIQTKLQISVLRGSMNWRLAVFGQILWVLWVLLHWPFGPLIPGSKRSDNVMLQSILLWISQVEIWIFLDCLMRLSYCKWEFKRKDVIKWYMYCI